MEKILRHFPLLFLFFWTINGATLDQLVVQMGQMGSVDEFIEKMVRMPGGTRVNMAIAQHIETESGRGVYSSTVNTVSLAQMDVCSPRPLTYFFPKDDDPNVLYFPDCTKVFQCGGCCNAKLLNCLPVESTTIRRKTLAVRYSQDGAGTFEYLGFKVMTIQNVTRCLARCAIQSTDCNPVKHIYRPDMCRCLCRNTAGVCPSIKRFDPVTCDCVCKNSDLNCGSQSVFNNATCTCQSGVLASGHVVPGSEETPEPTPTTPEPTTVHPCTPFVSCPPGWRPTYIPNTQRCSCMPGQLLVLPGGK